MTLSESALQRAHEMREGAAATWRRAHGARDAALSAWRDGAEARDDAVSRGLGWTSIGIGLAEITMPDRIGQWMGIEPERHTGLLRTMGVREVLQGVDLLSHRDPAPGVWARVAGDGLDGALLALAATRTQRPRGLAAVCALVLPIVAIDLLLGARLARRR